MSTVVAVVLAGGSGARFGGAKQLHLLDGITLLEHAVRTCSSVTGDVLVVLPPGVPLDVVQGEWPALRRVDGGATRLDSVRAALAAFAHHGDDTVVLLHDPAHPLAGETLARAVVDAVLDGAAGAVPAVPVVEALKVVDSAGVVVGTRSKVGLQLAQMPHAFRLGSLRLAHAGEPDGVEDSELVAALGAAVVAVPGDPSNVHVTTPAELELAAAILNGRGSLPAAGAPAGS